MKHFFMIVRGVGIALALLSVPLARATGPDGRVRCEIKRVLRGYYVSCENAHNQFYKTRPALLADLGDLEKRGVMFFDWEQIEAAMGKTDDTFGPDGRARCKASYGPVGFGIRVRCGASKPMLYAHFETLLYDLNSLERRGLMFFDWEQIRGVCESLHCLPQICKGITK